MKASDAGLVHQCAHNVFLYQNCVPCGRIIAGENVVEDHFDVVARPRHYNQGQIECIDAMIAAFGVEAVQTYCRINAFKYQWRAEYKGTAKQDLEKALWYLRFAMGDDPRDDLRSYRHKSTKG